MNLKKNSYKNKDSKKKILRSVMTVLMIFYGQAVFAKDHILVLAAGGFSDSLDEMGNSLKKLSIFLNNLEEAQINLLLADGSEKIQKEWESLDAKNNRKFDLISALTKNAVEAKIKEWTEAVQKNEIKAEEDKLVVIILSHGTPPNNLVKQLAQKTHKILMGHVNGIAYADQFLTLDIFFNLKSVTEKFNIPLAIIDLSCYSGHTQSLAGPKTCVVSSSGPFHPAVGNANNSFDVNFLKSLTTGSSLENAFLDALDAKLGIKEFPMISTAKGMDLKRELYDPILHFLMDLESENIVGVEEPLNSLHEEIIRQGKINYLEDGSMKIKETIDKMTALLKKKKDLSSLCPGDCSSEIEDFVQKLDVLKTNLNLYIPYLKRIQNNLLEMGAFEYNNYNEFCFNKKLDKECLPILRNAVCDQMSSAVLSQLCQDKLNSDTNCLLYERKYLLNRKEIDLELPLVFIKNGQDNIYKLNFSKRMCYFTVSDIVKKAKSAQKSLKALFLKHGSKIKDAYAFTVGDEKLQKISNSIREDINRLYYYEYKRHLQESVSENSICQNISFKVKNTQTPTPSD